VSGRPDPKRWTCRKCKRQHFDKRLLLCQGCGTRRKVRVSKHKQLLEAARPHYEAMLAAQGGRCAICRCEPRGRRFDIDHDHKRMVVRALLCHKCNRALPSWITPEWCEAAADYLRGNIVKAAA
jgi:hypothetical protein